jgi:hypothetical protein
MEWTKLPLGVNDVRAFSESVSDVALIDENAEHLCKFSYYFLIQVELSHTIVAVPLMKNFVANSGKLNRRSRRFSGIKVFD